MLALGAAKAKPVAMAPAAPQLKKSLRPMALPRVATGGAQQAHDAIRLEIDLKTGSDMGFTF
jgi:hypothetical protein